MKILFISDHYLQDSRLLETIGKAIKGSNETFIIIPNGRKFGFENSEPGMYYHRIISEPEIVQSAKKNIFGVLGKRFVSYLADASLPSLAISGDQKNIISVNENDTISIDLTTLTNYINQKIHIILCPFGDKQKNMIYVSPIAVLSELFRLGSTLYFLNEHLPPYGISKFSELKIWAESDPSIASSFDWLDEVDDGTPFHFINLLKLKQFQTDHSTLAVVKK